MAEKMTKMQACGALCTLQDSIKQRIKHLEEEYGAEKKALTISRWTQEEIERNKRWLRAIEMAGVALTR